jgi:hypothetical protein
MMKDKDILEFIYDRLLNVHGENENYDYMHRLKSILERSDNSQSTKGILVDKQQFICEHHADKLVEYHDCSILCTKCHKVIEQYGKKLY